MFNSDRPIDGAHEDLLGRGFFSKRIATAIANIQTNESIAIGLHGAWGSGKSSVINMIVEELEKYDSDVIVVRFNPWNRIEDSNLAAEYFQVLKESIDRKLKKADFDGKKLRELGKALEDYSETLKGGKKKAFARWASNRFVEKSDRQLGSIEKRKEKVSDILTSYKMKILVVVDDIDRLSDTQIRSIFQLVASIADFPSVNYLLSYDKDVVEKALSLIQGCNGSEYLEKVIQIPIRIPEIDRNKIANLLSEELNILSAYASTEKELSGMMDRAEVLRYCVFPYVETMRDLNRYRNVLLFELSGSKGKISPLDMAAITSISTFMPELIPWISNNKGRLCGRSGSGYIPDKAEKLRKEYEAEFAILLQNTRFSAMSAIEALSKLFPAFGQSVGLSLMVVTEESLRMQKMLAHEDIFDAYFKGTIDSYTFPHSQIMKMAFDYDEERVAAIVKESFGSNGYGQLLEGFLGISNEIDHLRSPLIFRSFVSCIGMTQDIGGFYSENWRTIRLLNAMLEASGIDEASSLVRTAVVELDLDGLIAFAPFVSQQERVFERYGLKGGGSYKRLIDLEALEFIEAKFTSVMKEGMKGLLVLRKEGLRISMYLWEKFDPESYEKCLKEAMGFPMGKALIAQLFTAQWHGGHTYGWTLDESFKVYISEEEVLEGVAKAVLEESFWKLPASVIERVAAFSIGIEKRLYGDGVDEINKSAVDKRIEEWRLGKAL